MLERFESSKKNSNKGVPSSPKHLGSVLQKHENHFLLFRFAVNGYDDGINL